MKRLSKLLALALALALVLALSTTAFAATITVNNPVAGQTYNAYKIFDVTVATGNSSYSYTINGDSSWYNDVASYVKGITLTQIAGTTNPAKYNVTFNQKPATVTEGDTTVYFDAADFASYLSSKVSGKTADATGTGTGNSNTITLEKPNDSTDTKTNLDLGYYFVTSSVGSLCVLNTAADAIVIKDKNELPTLSKKVDASDAGTTADWQDKNDADFGDTVKFKIEIAAEQGAVNYVLTDKLATGLNLDTNSIEVKGPVNKTETTLTKDTHYTLDTKATDAYSFKVTFNQEYLNTLVKGDKLTVTYSATVQSTAAVGATGNKNTATLTYGAKKDLSKNDSTDTYTWSFGISKVDSESNKLTGAKFKLYSDVACTQEIKLTKDATSGKYNVAAGGSDEIEAGEVTVQGLDSGVYYLKETEAPAGYNQLTGAITVTIEEIDTDTVTDGTVTYTYTIKNGTEDQNKTNTGTGATASVGGVIYVINNKGTTLPSTGGMGTTIFYVVGAVLVIGAGVLLVTKKRMSGTR